jgi:hypothetical protein
MDPSLAALRKITQVGAAGGRARGALSVEISVGSQSLPRLGPSLCPCGACGYCDAGKSGGERLIVHGR